MQKGKIIHIIYIEKNIHLMKMLPVLLWRKNSTKKTRYEAEYYGEIDEHMMDSVMWKKSKIS